nr:MAG TPA: hypothetical protein [Crassvirales sp.]
MLAISVKCIPIDVPYTYIPNILVPPLILPKDNSLALSVA